MSGESVGRVAVEVVPDASDFRRKAQAELERQRLDPKNVDLVPAIDANMGALQARMEQIAQSLDRTAQITVDVDHSGLSAIAGALRFTPNDITVPVRWDPDSETGIRRMLDQIEATFSDKWHLEVTADNAEQIAADLRSQLDEIEREKVRIAAQITLDEQATEQRVTAMRARIQTMLHTNLHVGMDTDVVDEQIARLRAETADWKAEIELGVNQPSIEATRTYLQRTFADVNARVRATYDDTAGKATQARLALLQRARAVPLAPEISRAAYAAASASLAFLARDRVSTIITRAGKGIVGIGSVLSGFDALHKNIGQARKAFTGLFTNLPAVAGVTVAIFALAGALLSTAAAAASFAGQIASALPVLLTLPGIAIGVATMAAAFKDFGTVLPGVTAQLKQLQPLISQAFWAEAKAGVASLAADIAGPLRQGLAQTSTAIGAFIGTLSAQLGAALATDGGLSSWFANLQASVVTFAPAITSLVSVFTQFGQTGSAMLVPLADMFADLTARFDAWYARLVEAAGGVQAFAAQSVAALQGIVEFAIQLGAIFGATFRAAQDSGTMTFTSLAEQMRAWAHDGGLGRLQERLTTLFAAAHTMWDNFGEAASDAFGGAMDNVTKLLSAVLPVVGTIMGTLTQLLAAALTPEATAGIAAFVDGVSAGVAAMQPAFALIGPIIGALGPVLGQLAETIGNVFGALTPAVDSLLPAITPIIQILGNGLVTVIQKVSPLIEQLGAILTEALTSDAFLAALDAIIAAIVSLIPILQPIIGLVGRLLPILLPIVTAILEPIAGLIGMLAPLLDPIVEVIVGIVSALTPLIPMLVNLITAILEPILPLIAALATAILPLLIPIIQVVATVLQLVIGLLTPLLELILPPLIGLITILADVFGVVATAISAFLQGALQWLQDGITNVSVAISGFLQGWQDMWTKVLTFFQDIWTNLLNWIKDLLGIHSPSRWFLDLAANMLAGMLAGLKAGWDFIVGFFTEAWQWLQAMWTAQFEAVVAIVQYAWDTVVTVFTAAWELLRSVVVGGANAVTGLFVDALTGIVGLVTAGWARVGSMFTGGITNVVALVKSLPGRIVSALGNLGRTLYGAGRSLVQGLLAGIGSLAATIGNWFLNKIPAWIRDPFKAALGIHSPSTVFRGFGQNIVEGLIAGMESAHYKVFRSMDGLAAGMAETTFALPTVSGGLAAVATQIADAIGAGASRTLNYYAAPGSGLSSEEELFAAAGRGRMVW